MGYPEDVASLRQAAAERSMRQVVDRSAELVEEIVQAERRSHDAAKNGWHDAALDAASDANQAHGELNSILAMLPPEQPQLSDAKAWFMQRHKSFIDKNGTTAIGMLGHAHNYVTNPQTGSPQTHGMGLREDTPQYFKAMEDLMHLYGKQVAGVHFDPEAHDLTPDEAARISGLTDQEYNWYQREMYRLGQDSGTLERGRGGR